jgi:hypothetical protein
MSPGNPHIKGLSARGLHGVNDVSPNARFCGISRAMIGALEAQAAARGNAPCALASILYLLVSA